METSGEKIGKEEEGKEVKDFLADFREEEEERRG